MWLVWAIYNFIQNLLWISDATIKHDVVTLAD